MRLPTNEKSFRFFIFIRISVFLETMSYIPQTPKTKQIQILRNHLQLLLLLLLLLLFLKKEMMPFSAL